MATTNNTTNNTTTTTRHQGLPEMSHNIFPFFDLPLELRNMIYNYATQPGQARARIHICSTQKIIEIRFNHAWIPHLLRVNRQFKQEYFDEVCGTRLTCAVRIGMFTRLSSGDQLPAALPLNPPSALEALSKVRVLVSNGAAIRMHHLEAYSTALHDTIAPLLASLPKVRLYREHFHTPGPALDQFLKPHHNDIRALRVFRAHLDAKKSCVPLHLPNSTRKITHQRTLYMATYLALDRVTRRASTRKLMLFSAVPSQGKVREEYLWHGLLLTPRILRDEKGMLTYM